MPVLTVVLAVLLVGAVTGGLVWLTGTRPASLADQALADPVSSSPFEGLAPGPVVPDEVRDLRFDQVLRGYRMDQVDDTLDRLVEELRARDAEIDRLRSAVMPVGSARRGWAEDPAQHPDVTTGPLDVTEIVRPSGGSTLWRRPDRPADDLTP
ncbi:DivIVA domain-containing protein [Arsenicicoccus sp. oral taxon 190]|uniref:DivIVA domain-containing protein n=1 Tax=Arsenicicoccus sp. oral taxon 190 TaxID=1658671 RepID=UPI00067B4E8C|nr:DivIVA domain-containing protein [Arsenicicoccus sp. oral taxon 190]